MPRRKHIIQPIERFPKKPRRDGRFQKKIHGKFYYFGKHGDREAALKEYDAVKTYLYAGIAPPLAVIARGTLTLKEVVNRYLLLRNEDAQLGRIRRGTYNDHVTALLRFLAYFGDGRLAGSLGPEDFASYSQHLGGRFGPYAFNRERASVVALFNHAEDCHWLEDAVRMGRQFGKQAVDREEKRTRLVSPADFKAVWTEAHPQLRAMMLLGVTGGYGNTDCGELPRERVDLATAFIRGYRRRKTKIPRDTPLVPEAVASLSVVMSKRPDDPYIFRTPRGNLWTDTAVAHSLSTVVEGVNEGRKEPIYFTFYDLRHTFATYANEARDADARRRIMGRRLTELDDTYVQAVFEERLRAVVNHVRSRFIAPLSLPT